MGKLKGNKSSSAESKNLEAKCDEYLAGWKRALADYDNLKKDLSAEKDRIRKSSKEDFIMQLIPILDNFEQATKFYTSEFSGKSDIVDQMLEGYRLISVQLSSILKDMGAERDGNEGEIFDPFRHEAIDQRDDNKKKEGEILEVISSGWRIGDKIIRPAKVIINKKKNN